MFAYARSQDGVVSTAHNVATEGNRRHHVPFFNPAQLGQLALLSELYLQFNRLSGPAALAVRIDHEVAVPPLAITRVLDSVGSVLAESLAEAAPPSTVSTASGQWRTEYVFELPGSLYRAGNQLVHVIDPDDKLAETDEDEDRTDVMSYCGRYEFVSGYHYRKALDYRLRRHPVSGTLEVQPYLQSSSAVQQTPGSATGPGVRGPVAESETGGGLALSGRVASWGGIQCHRRYRRHHRLRRYPRPPRRRAAKLTHAGAETQPGHIG